MSKKIEKREYDVTIKATLVVRVRARNAFLAIHVAEDALQEQLAGADIDLEEYRTTSSSSVEDK